MRGAQIIADLCFGKGPAGIGIEIRFSVRPWDVSRPRPGHNVDDRDWMFSTCKRGPCWTPRQLIIAGQSDKCELVLAHRKSFCPRSRARVSAVVADLALYPDGYSLCTRCAADIRGV
jgi:hypothetical protein